MANAVTTTGLDAYRAGLSRFPAVVRLAFQTTAAHTAATIAARARANAAARGWRVLPQEVRVEHLPSEQRYRIVVRPTPPRPANLPLWLEFGTSKMTPRPFILQPAREANARYPADVDAALQAACDQTVNA